MIEFLKDHDLLLMRYTPERSGEDWLVEPLQTDAEIPLSGRAFFVRQEIYQGDLQYDSMDGCYDFIIGRKEQDYYRIDRNVLGIEYDLFMHESLSYKRTTFVAETNISIFRGINAFELSELWIGGDRDNSLPKQEFERMLKEFPNTYELKKYARARVSGIIRNYVPLNKDLESDYRKYMKRKSSRVGSQPLKTFSPYETEKYSNLIDKIELMLQQADAYTEDQWQTEIWQIIQLLYPKYVKAFKEAPVRDSLAQKNRRIDFLLVDASGYVDAIEIKKPFAECIVTTNRYRDNHVPMRELSGTVMQMEKYLYHLNRWGQQGERVLNRKYSDQLPNGLELKIVNPSGMIIMGRDEGLSDTQRNDFEVIRRKYRNVLEIMTYDDILRRLKVIRDQLSQTI